MMQAISEIKVALGRHQIDTVSLPNRVDRRKYNLDQMVTTSEEDCVMLKIVIFGAFYPNYFVRTGLGPTEKEAYKELYNNTTSTYHDLNSCIYFRNFDPQQAKYGAVYENQIKDMFDGFDNRNIHVEFDGQKIIIKFDRSTQERNTILTEMNSQNQISAITDEIIHLNCDILHEVYVAMKLCREPHGAMMIKLYKPEIAQQYFRDIQNGCQELSFSSMRDATSKAIGMKNPPYPDQNFDSTGARKRENSKDTIMSSSPHYNKGTYHEQRTSSVQLKGPYHPLQFNVVSTHRIGSSKKANIEPDSVNSVLLGKSPNDKHDVWLVAGHVGTNTSGDALVLRSTTLMPNKEGLGALLAMVFAPVVEMRYNPKKQRYTGCLLGLGSRKYGEGKKSKSHKPFKSRESSDTSGWSCSTHDSTDEVSYHPEHDMEIQFDVNIDNDDIKLINQLRYRIGIALTRINDKKDGRRLPLEQRMREVPTMLTIRNYLIEAQDDIQKIVKKLLMSKRRKPKTPRRFKHEYIWNQLPGADKIRHTRIQNEDELLLKMITKIIFPRDLINDLSLK